MDELNPQVPQNNSVPQIPREPQPQTNVVPPPPAAPELLVRTMESDVRTASANGGEPTPQVVTPPPPMATPPQPIRPAEPSPVQFPQAPAPAPMPQVREVRSGRVLVWLFMLIVIVGIGWVSYKYGLPAYRAMMPNEPAAPATTETQASQPAASALPTPPAPAAPVPVTTPLGANRDSLTKIETDGTATSIATALLAAAQKTKMASGTIQEVSILNAGAPMSFDTYMNALLPEAKTNGLSDIFTAGFDPVFSAYFFYDDRGAWPGYIAKINPASQIDPITLASRLQAIEKSSYKALFLADPGTGKEFRTGQAREKYIDRFIPLSADGALFSYGVFGDYVIVNTSNNGLVKALDLLKL